MAVRIDIQSESGTSNDPARVRVYENNTLVAERIARIEPMQGADGGWYRCIELENKKLEPVVAKPESITGPTPRSS